MDIRKTQAYRLYMYRFVVLWWLVGRMQGFCCAAVTAAAYVVDLICTLVSLFTLFSLSVYSKDNRKMKKV